MTMDERVEAAARRMCEVDKLAPDPDAPIIWNGKPAKAWEARVPIVLAVAEVLWPELHGDQPKGWIAPWEATEEMNDAVDDARDRYDHEFITSSRAFQVARDAYLGKGDGG